MTVVDLHGNPVEQPGSVVSIASLQRTLSELRDELSDGAILYDFSLMYPTAGMRGRPTTEWLPSLLSMLSTADREMLDTYRVRFDRIRDTMHSVARLLGQEPPAIEGEEAHPDRFIGFLMLAWKDAPTIIKRGHDLVLQEMAAEREPLSPLLDAGTAPERLEDESRQTELASVLTTERAIEEPISVVEAVTSTPLVPILSEATVTLEAAPTIEGAQPADDTPNDASSGEEFTHTKDENDDLDEIPQPMPAPSTASRESRALSLPEKPTPDSEWYLALDMQELRRANELVHLLLRGLRAFSKESADLTAHQRRSFGPIRLGYEGIDFDAVLADSRIAAGDDLNSRRCALMLSSVPSRTASASVTLPHPQVAILYNARSKQTPYRQAQVLLLGSAQAPILRSRLGDWLRDHIAARFDTEVNIVRLMHDAADGAAFQSALADVAQRTFELLARHEREVVAHLSVRSAKASALLFPQMGRTASKSDVYLFSLLGVTNMWEEYAYQLAAEKKAVPNLPHFKERVVALMPFLMAEAVLRIYLPSSAFNAARGGDRSRRTAIWRGIRVDKEFFFAQYLGVEEDKLHEMWAKLCRLS